MIWIYKCNSQNRPHQAAYGDWNDFFFEDATGQWGSTEWCRSDLRNAKRGDTILAYQSNRNELVGIVKVIRWKSRGDYRDLILKPLHRIGVKVKPLKESDPRIDAIPALKPGRIQTLYPIDRSDANLLLQAAGVSIQLGPDADYGTLTAIERKKIVQHEQEEQWARDRGLAHKCKVRDGYSCQICGFCPSKMYKRINASGAVEAHHRTPFSALSLHRKHVNTKLKDLITVCRNCHAALHAPSVGGNVSIVSRAFTGQWPKGTLN